MPIRITHRSSGGGLDGAGNLVIDSADAVYIGSTGVNGSWRLIRSSNDFVFQRRESDVWVEKSAFIP